MAKQTFTTGQVLTAAQMTSLQQTAMGGGSPSVKTTSYILVAADAGTVIQMNSASSTTITVNTSLFSAGDSVQIQNIGAGTCTITAGTATVNSAGSLAVTQYDGGFLYFSSASSALWFDYTQAGTTSPLTTKGDLYTRTSSADARLPIGANGTTLVADSAEATGLKWQAPASGGGMTLLSTTTLSGTSTTISSIDQTYKHLLIVVRGIYCSASIDGIIRLNGDSGNNYSSIDNWAANTGGGNPYTRGSVGGNSIQYFAAGTTNDFDNDGYIRLNIYRYAETEYKLIEYIAAGYTSSWGYTNTFAAYNSTTAISSITFGTGAATTFSGGTVYIYGVK